MLDRVFYWIGFPKKPGIC